MHMFSVIRCSFSKQLKSGDSPSVELCVFNFQYFTITFLTLNNQYQLCVIFPYLRSFSLSSKCLKQPIILFALYYVPPGTSGSPFNHAWPFKHQSHIYIENRDIMMTTLLSCKHWHHESFAFQCIQHLNLVITVSKRAKDSPSTVLITKIV